MNDRKSKWWKRLNVLLATLFVAACLYNEPSWFQRWVVGPINWLIDGWGNYSIYDYQAPPQPQLPPPGNQGPCPCG